MRILNLIFPKDKVTDSVICNLGKKFDVVYNIRQASISKDQQGLLILSIEGNDIPEAILWLENKGILVSDFDASCQAF